MLNSFYAPFEFTWKSPKDIWGFRLSLWSFNTRRAPYMTMHSHTCHRQKHQNTLGILQKQHIHTRIHTYVHVLLCPHIYLFDWACTKMCMRMISATGNMVTMLPGCCGGVRSCVSVLNVENFTLYLNERFFFGWTLHVHMLDHLDSIYTYVCVFACICLYTCVLWRLMLHCHCWLVGWLVGLCPDEYSFNIQSRFFCYLMFLLSLFVTVKVSFCCCCCRASELLCCCECWNIFPRYSFVWVCMCK